MKDKLIAAIREVPISKTYDEYVEALADRLMCMAEDIRTEARENTICEIDKHLLSLIPVRERSAR